MRPGGVTIPAESVPGVLPTPLSEEQCCGADGDAGEARSGDAKHPQLVLACPDEEAAEIYLESGVAHVVRVHARGVSAGGGSVGVHGTLLLWLRHPAGGGVGNSLNPSAKIGILF